MRLLRSYRLRRGRRRGVTLIELLVASVIVATSLMGLVSAWMFSFQVTRRSDETEVAYNLARSAVEQLRAYGFYYADPSIIPAWYDVNQQQTASSTGAYYHLVVAVRNGSDAPPGAGHLILRQVDATVTRVSDGTAIYHTSTYLALGGA